MKKGIIALLCIAVLAGGGYFGYRQYQKSRDEKKIVDVIPVSMIAEPADMFMYTGGDMYGRINAANAQRVYVDTEKLVQKVCVQKGQKVKKGDTILEYDMTVVELELAQKQNQVQLIEQNIVMAEKELQEIRTYRPAEEAPVQNVPDFDWTEPEIPEEPEPPEEPEIPEEPLITVNELGAAFTPASGKGTQEEPFIINCNLRTVVRQPFQLAIASASRYVQLHVYSDDGEFLYMWILSGSSISIPETTDWNVTDGLTVDEATGTVSIDPDGVMHGQLSFAMPQREPDMDFDADFDPDADADFSGDDWGGMLPDFDTGAEQPDDGKNYVYTRIELARMISEKENSIKQLQIDLKSAQLALETAQKQQSDGKVVAEIDGIVKKIGKAADDAEGEESDGEDNELDDEFESGSPEDDNSFAVIEGEGGAEVICSAAELSLPNLQVGTRLDVMSYSNGASSEAEIVEVETEPTSYSAQNWGDNPQNSTYQIHAKLLESDEFIIGDWVNVTMQSDGSGGSSNSVYMPIHYVRQEGGEYYIMKADENDRLVKQYVRAGQVMWGYYIEITGGLDIKKDRICFPYGTDVKEGVKTQNTTEILYPTY